MGLRTRRLRLDLIPHVTDLSFNPPPLQTLNQSLWIIVERTVFEDHSSEAFGNRIREQT